MLTGVQLHLYTKSTYHFAIESCQLVAHIETAGLCGFACNISAFRSGTAGVLLPFISHPRPPPPTAAVNYRLGNLLLNKRRLRRPIDVLNVAAIALASNPSLTDIWAEWGPVGLTYPQQCLSISLFLPASAPWFTPSRDSSMTTWHVVSNIHIFGFHVYLYTETPHTVDLLCASNRRARMTLSLSPNKRKTLWLALC